MAGKHKTLQERSRRQERRREHESHGDSKDHVAFNQKKVGAEKNPMPEEK